MKTESVVKEFLSPVKKTRVIEEILGKMRALVDSGKLAPGSKLPPERDLCTMLSVSRPSLREALKVLDILGVIKTRQGSGTYVTGSFAKIIADPQKARIIDARANLFLVLETRRIVEPSVAALAAVRATEEDLKAIENALEGMCRTQDARVKLKFDEQFHRAIIKAANNPLLGQMMAIIWDSLLEIFWTTDHSTEDPEKSDENHRQVFLAIKRRDAASAKRAMQTVMKLTEKDLLRSEKRNPAGSRSSLTPLH
ncbi:MAG: FadR/GntR family transcriptional regulator [Acidobacteriota bacterium]